MRPCAQSLFHGAWLVEPGGGEDVEKHVAGTPANAAPAAKMSGYVASITCVVMAPDEVPVTNTRDASVE